VKARRHFRLLPKRSNKPRRLPQTLNRRNMPSAAAAVPSRSAIVNSWSAITPATLIGLGRNGRLTTHLITALPRRHPRQCVHGCVRNADRKSVVKPSTKRVSSAIWFRCGHDERADQPARNRSAKRREIADAITGDGAGDCGRDFVFCLERLRVGGDLVTVPFCKPGSILQTDDLHAFFSPEKSVEHKRL